MPVNPYAKTYGSSRRRRRLLPKLSSEDAVAEFNNALDAVATDELESPQQRGAATTTAGDDSSNTVSAFESFKIAASIIPPEDLHSSEGIDAVDRNARCAAAEVPGDEKESGDTSSHHVVLEKRERQHRPCRRHRPRLRVG